VAFEQDLEEEDEPTTHLCGKVFQAERTSTKALRWNQRKARSPGN
jgi:hypothetical protein